MGFGYRGRVKEKEIRGINEKGRNKENKRGKEREKKESKREVGCRPNYCLLLNVTVCSDEKKNWIFFFLAT